MDTIEGTNIVKVTDSDTNETMYYKALDKDGNPIKLVNRTTGELMDQENQHLQKITEMILGT